MERDRLLYTFASRALAELLVFIQFIAFNILQDDPKEKDRKDQTEFLIQAIIGDPSYPTPFLCLTELYFEMNDENIKGLFTIKLHQDYLHALLGYVNKRNGYIKKALAYFKSVSTDGQKLMPYIPDLVKHLEKNISIFNFK